MRLEAHPKLRTDLVESRQEEGGEAFYFVKDPLTQRFFRLREVEYQIVRSLDGQTSLSDVAGRIEAQHSIKLPLEQLERFVAKLDELLFLESERNQKKLDDIAKSWEKKDKTFLQRVLFIKLKAFDPNELITKLEKNFNFVFSPYFLALGLLFSLLALRVTYLRWEEFAALTVGQIFRAESILVLLIAVFGTISLHEFAHAMTLKHFGGEVRQMGFLLLYFQPCFYCDVSDAYLLPEKRKKILVTFAGVIFQTFVWSLSTLAWHLLPAESALGHLFFIASAFTLLTVLFNLNPLIKLDGYYLLTDWVGIPNLRAKAFGYLKAKLLETAFGLTPRLPNYSRRERRIFLWYGVLALVYSVFFLGYFFLWLFGAVTSAWRGLGFILFSAFLLFIFGEPVARTARKAAAFIEKENLKKLSPTKLTVTLGLAVLFLAFFFFFPYPQTVSGEAEIEPLAAYTVSSPPTGVRLMEEKLVVGGEEHRGSTQFISLLQTDLPSIGFQPKVKAGDFVKAGDTLIFLASNPALSELKSTRETLIQARSRLDLLKAGAKPEDLERQREAVRRTKLDFDQKERDLAVAQKLLDKKAISPEEFQRTKNGRDIAEAAWREADQSLASLLSGARPEEIKNAQAEVSRLEARIHYQESQMAKQIVVSPIPGRVAVVGEPPVLVRIVRLDSVRALTKVAETDLDLVREGLPLEARLWGYPRRPYTGVVQRVGSEVVERHSKSMFKVAGVLANPDGRLKSGMTGKVKIQVGRRPLFKIFWRSVVRFFKVEFWNWW